MKNSIWKNINANPFYKKQRLIYCIKLSVLIWAVYKYCMVVEWIRSAGHGWCAAGVICRNRRARDSCATRLGCRCRCLDCLRRWLMIWGGRGPRDQGVLPTQTHIRTHRFYTMVQCILAPVYSITHTQMKKHVYQTHVQTFSRDLYTQTYKQAFRHMHKFKFLCMFMHT